jgi:hypothetical protein
MSTLAIKDISQIYELDTKTMSTIAGGMINLERMPKPPIDADHGGGGTSWPKDGMRGLSPVFAYDGSPAPVRPY